MRVHGLGQPCRTTISLIEIGAKGNVQRFETGWLLCAPIFLPTSYRIVTERRGQFSDPSDYAGVSGATAPTALTLEEAAWSLRSLIRRALGLRQGARSFLVRSEPRLLS